MSLVDALMSACDRKGCKHVPLYAPKLHVPFEGLSLSQHDPINAILGLRLCERHINEVSVKDFGAIEIMFEQLAGSTASLKFDWPRAFFTKVRLDSSEYAEFEGKPNA